MRLATIIMLIIMLTGCGATGGETVTVPRSDGRPPYTTPNSCLIAIDAAQEFMQAHGPTVRRDYLLGLIGEAFHAGGRHDLITGAQILRGVRQDTAQETADAKRLAKRFDTAAADCRS